MWFVSAVDNVSATDVAAVLGAKLREWVSISETASPLVISGRSESDAMVQTSGLNVLMSICESGLSIPIRTDGIG